MHRGFAKVYRKFLEWEWYTDTPCRSVYIHCLLKANHADKKYKGKVVQRGSFLTSRDDLAREIGISVQQVRTALLKLEGEYLTIKATKQGTCISVVDFEAYNGDDSRSNQQPNQQLTNEQPTANQQLTTTKNIKKGKNDKNDKNTDTPEFVEFWKLYPRRVNKGAARRAHKAALKKASASVIMEALKKQLPEISTRDPQYIQHPSSWLNGEAWENETTTRSSAGEHYGGAYKVVNTDDYRNL